MALTAGRNQAVPCREQIEHDADEFLDCIRVRSEPGFGGLDPQTVFDEPRRLGVLFFGWFTADLDAAFALEGASEGARRLLPQVLRLQKQLDVSDETLCLLIDAPCRSILERKREAQSELQQEPAKTQAASQSDVLPQ